MPISHFFNKKLTKCLLYIKNVLLLPLEITKLKDSKNRLCKIAHSSFTVFIFTLPNKQSGTSHTIIKEFE